MQPERKVIHILECADLWFEPDQRGAALMVSFTAKQMSAACALESFPVASDLGVLQLRYVATIRGQRVYAASELRRGHDSVPSQSGALWQLSGPQRGGR